MSKKQEKLFFIGKGGVGKSTASALAALKFSGKGVKTGLISMDPAHNIGDILETKCSEKSRKIKDNLWVKEVDEQIWMKRYLQETQQNMERRYNYHRAFALKNYFKVLRYSPGLEEYALTLAFGHILREFKDFQLLIFDMPPTALALKFFALPSLTLVWLNELQQLRRQIYQKKEIISRIKMGSKTLESDSILNKLKEMEEGQKRIQAIFQADTSQINLVVNEDPLSLAESLKIKKKLQELDKNIARIIINKSSNSEPPHELIREFPSAQIQRLTKTHLPLIGMQHLHAFLQENREYLMDAE